jgi:hypothetical protein
MRGGCGKRLPRVRLKRVNGFVRAIVLALIVSVTGLSSALVICVTGCSDDVARLTDAAAEQPCHETGDRDRRTIGNEYRGCTHEPAVLDSGVLSFDTRLSAFVPAIEVTAADSPNVALLDSAHAAIVRAPIPSHTPPATLRI